MSYHYHPECDEQPGKIDHVLMTALVVLFLVLAIGCLLVFAK